MRTVRRVWVLGALAMAWVLRADTAAAAVQGVAGGQPWWGSPAASWADGGVQGGVDIWLEGEPSYFRRGDRLNVRFSVPRDSYIAIVHIDSDGVLDFLYPSSPWDDGFVRGGARWQSLPVRSLASTTIRSRPGIGYLYLVASPYPLDFSYFRAGRFGSAWDWGYAGRNVYGDPFLAFEQITRLILPGWPYTEYAWDYHGYYVEGLHRYPTYACSNQLRTWGWGWYPEYGPCSRLDVFVRNNPYYYDTRQYRGDRRVIVRQYERLDPRYGFKEDPDRDPRGNPARAPAPPVRDVNPPNRDEVPRRDPVTAPGPAQPGRPEVAPSRPTVPTREPVSQSGAAPVRETGVPARAPAAASPIPAQREPATRPAPAPSRSAADPRTDASNERARPAPSTGSAQPASNVPASGSTQNGPARRPAP